MHRKRFLFLLLPAVLLLLLGSALAVHAQDWSFTLDREVVDVWINPDGSVRIHYAFTFTCDPGAHPIDAVDVALPTGDFSVSDIRATVDESPAVVDAGDYQGEGAYGVAILLGAAQINPGRTGTVRVEIDRVGGMVYEDTEDSGYASSEFGPTYFGWGVHGFTDMTVRLHLPLGVQPEEPRWHGSPSGWPSEPTSYHDEEGRIVYEWRKADAAPDRSYVFGASFPRQYVSEGAIQKGPSLLQTIWAGLSKVLCNPVLWVVLFIALIVFVSVRSQARRRMEYLPPSMKVEGVGIKRGLTAVEAAIVLETPLNKVLTMILFGLVKKGAVTVLDDDPLRVQVNEPLPETLHPYEADFVKAVEKGGTLKEAALRTMMVDLVKSVNNKMKGFSRKETMTYYRDVIRRAWEQVEGAETPEVRGQLFGDGLEWTMLDEDFQERTERTLREGPVFVPIWWGHYRPWAQTLPSAGAGGAVPAGGGTAGRIQLPTLPGADFAASIVRGIEGTAGRIVGSLTGFTGSVTQVTNPSPKASSGYRGGSSRGGGCACACACACAGCACACAGGGR